MFIKKIKTQSGFTVLELLVVIAIIGILSAIIISQVANARARGRDTRRIEDVRTLQTALELYFTANYKYPTSTQFTTAGGATNLTPIYIKTLPKDPKTGVNYLYTGLSLVATASCSGYHMGTNLEQSNQVLSFDNDYTSSSLSLTRKCGVAGGFAGTDVSPHARLYDVYK